MCRSVNHFWGFEACSSVSPGGQWKALLIRARLVTSCLWSCLPAGGLQGLSGCLLPHSSWSKVRVSSQQHTGHLCLRRD